MLVLYPNASNIISISIGKITMTNPFLIPTVASIVDDEIADNVENLNEGRSLTVHYDADKEAFISLLNSLLWDADEEELGQARGK